MTPDLWGPSWFDELYETIEELPQHPEDVQAAIRRELAKDPIAFAIIYFGHHLENRTTGLITFSEIHFEWARHALTWRKPVSAPMENRNAFIGPRESGKTTWWFLILPLWAAANDHKKFAVAFAHCAGQAEGHLSTLKGELDSNVFSATTFQTLSPRRDALAPVLPSPDRQGLLHTAKGFRLRRQRSRQPGPRPEGWVATT